jgi:hypothetical protein
MHTDVRSHNQDSLISPPTFLRQRNSGNPSSVPQSDPAFENSAPVDLRSLKRELKCLKRLLLGRIPQVVAAKQTIDAIVPLLAQMQAVLSQRGSSRKDIAKQSALPTWSAFLSFFAKRIGYSTRQLRNLIRIHREPEKKPRKSKAPNCKSPFASLLDWLDTYGDHLPVILSDVRRNAEQFMIGNVTLRQWREKEDDLHERHQRQQDASRDSQLAGETGRIIGLTSYLM